MKLFSRQQSVPARRRSSVSSEGSPRASSDEFAERYAFRRNRTLTGSLSSSVTSVNEHRAELKSSRIHAHELRHHRRRLTVVLIGCLVVVVLLTTLLYQFIALPRVVAATSVPIDEQYYEAKVQSYLDSHFFERTRLTLNTAQLAAYLRQSGSPEVATVSPDVSFGGSLGIAQLTLAFRTPAVSWKTGDSLLYVDTDGVAFARNYFSAPKVQVVDETGIQTQNNQVLASDRFLGFIGKVIGRMREEGFQATKVVLPADTTHQIWVYVKGEHYPIKFSVDRPAGEQAEDAARAIRYLHRKGVDVQYLDVRVSGKAFYK